MMKRFGEFLLAKDANAILVAFLAALLPLFYLPTGFIAAIILGLVTLKKGPKAGFWLLAWIALPSIALLVLHQVGVADLLLLRCGVIWVLAALLYRYHSWALLLEVLAVAGVVGIALLHAFKPDILQWWITELTRYLSQMHWKIQITPEVFAQRIAPIASGVSAFFFAATIVLELIVARWWQSVIVNSSEFAQAFLQIRMGKVTVALLGLLLLLVALKVPFALDALPIALLPFCIAGLSLLHFLVRQKKQWMFLLVLIYVGFFFLPVMAVSVLVIMAFIDTGRNLRKN